MDIADAVEEIKQGSSLWDEDQDSLAGYLAMHPELLAALVPGSVVVDLLAHLEQKLGKGLFHSTRSRRPCDMSQQLSWRKPGRHPNQPQTNKGLRSATCTLHTQHLPSFC